MGDEETTRLRAPESGSKYFGYGFAGQREYDLELFSNSERVTRQRPGYCIEVAQVIG